jgi:hypothetical protein
LGLKIFFDVDYTILAVDNSLRPGTRDTFEKLISDGHEVYIWSGVGLRNAEIRQHELEELVSGVYRKPIQNFVAGLSEYEVPHWPDFVIDDYPEIVETFGGVVCQPYYFRSASDDEMERIYGIISEFASTGESDQVGYRAATNGRPPDQE